MIIQQKGRQRELEELSGNNIDGDHNEDQQP